MRRIYLLCAAILVLFGTANIMTYAASPEEEVKAAYAAWDQAFSKGDAKAIAAFYTNDAIFPPGYP